MTEPARCRLFLLDDMKKTIKFLCVAVLALGVYSCAQKPNTLSKAEQAQGWELLFNGVDMTGWRDFNGTELTNGWKVVDGCIQAPGDGSDGSGYIVTDRKFADFELVWDWKLTHGGNSGMIYHVQEGPKFSVPYVTGPEYQLIDNDGWEEVNAPAKLQPWQRLGVDYAMHLPDEANMPVNPQGQWNTSKIVFDNGHVEHWINGVKILEFQAWTDDWFEKKNSGKWADAPEYGLAHEGVICLQDHGDPASFRNIKIRELPHKPAAEVKSLFNGKDLEGWELFGCMNMYVNAEGNLVTENGKEQEYGYLGTREYYKDFDLSVQFKQVSNGNSGLFFHSFVTDYNIVNGWQCEVAPQGCDTAGIYESYGRGWLVQIPDEKETILKPGEWNDLRLRVEGDHVQTWLNGEPMIDINDECFAKSTGRIMLQVHDGCDIVVLWRNFMLQEL